MADIFLTNVPFQAREAQLKKELANYCKRIDIFAFDVHVIRSRQGRSNCALITVPSKDLMDLFIKCYGSMGRYSQPRIQIMIMGQPVYCKLSNKPPRDDHMVLSLATQQKDAMEAKKKPLSDFKKRGIKSFVISGIQCGTWAAESRDERTTTFNPRYSITQPGHLHFRSQSILVEVDSLVNPGGYSLSEPEAQKYTLIIYYYTLVQILTNSRSEILFVLSSAPKIYRNKKTADPVLGELLIRERISGIDPEHEAFAGFSFIYKAILGNKDDHSSIIRLGKTAGIPPIEPKIISTMPPRVCFVDAFTELIAELQNSQKYPFDVAFQINALVSNGVISPESAIELLPRVKMLVVEDGEFISAQALHSFVQCFSSSVLADPQILSGGSLLAILEKRINAARRIATPQFVRDHKNKEGSMAYVHRILITPTGVFSYGPRWEASNRVLRKYSGYHSYFLRVYFCEEDGETFSHEPRVNADKILYSQFLPRLDPKMGGAVVIAGRQFSFLGFSNSSLKSQTCWFMAPFKSDGRILTPEAVIAELGDFSKITTPGRYAARVGQAFSDTIGTAQVHADSEVQIHDVERPDSKNKRRVFSDGVGKVSFDLVRRIWKSSEQLKQEEPTVFQIRYAGAKGMICLDPTLRGDKLCLRPSMIKFEGSHDRIIEICTWAKRLPMVLNRPLIKVLEDLGVPHSVFMQLQEDAINRLRESSKNPLLAANFIKRRAVGSNALRLPWVIEGMKALQMDFWDDPFLESALELALLTSLRDIKYKGRIPVPKGITLIGVLDETKYLGEGEIFISTVNDKGDVERIEGQVLITRSPIHHPGDVQMVKAVNVPRYSPLRFLQNCVVFSQKGDRPLPSMLAGGDLDGDLYNIIYDKRFSLDKSEEPAEYELVTPVDLGRPVEVSDIAKFFVDFIQNNLLGLISNRHLLIADQKAEGVRHPDCLILAEMASIAVDFPKTGRQVDRKKFPRASTAKPDFFAPGPRVLIAKDKVVHEIEQEVDEDEDTFQHWYPSDKILGKLYRKINEEKFLDEIRREIEESGPGLYENSLLDRLWCYMERQTNGYQTWRDHLDFAKDARFRYDEQVYYLMTEFSETPWKSRLLEVEVFVGTIVGREKSTRQQRELSSRMKDDYERHVSYTINELKGDSRAETLGRCMACLWLCLPSNNRRRYNTLEGELKSFAWLVVSVLMSEVDALQKENAKRVEVRLKAPKASK